MPERKPNLRPGALPRIEVGDRWLIRCRGATKNLTCVVLSKRHRGYWSVCLGSRGRIEVHATCFVEHLPPRPSELLVELVKVRREVARLADELAEVRALVEAKP